ncbi:DUF86 domain-containing protein [Jiella sp. CBK1P-4]|uniref:DUF86 domain-containing protein n=1 Tax=Jiella avicenniae TaxID=2907202 RepID=A0A9X1NY42_9HYPH|nr:HepT-like ribonuclease domain-containing protein [Jiella avicenniae]MCE7026870.1 DUF86 domain-containing protein [Jiella avicenniae]
MLPAMDIGLLQTSQMHQLALSKAVELVGEAAAGIVRKYPGFCDARSDLQLRPAVAVRNLLVHGYDGISFERLWDIANHDVVILSRSLEPILTDAGEDLP